MKTKKNKIDEIEKLRKEQHITRIIGIICLFLGAALYSFFPLFNLIAAPASFMLVAGVVMTIRSFAHSKFSVLKDEPEESVRFPERSFQTAGGHPLNLLMTSQLVALYWTHVGEQDAEHYRDHYLSRLEGIGICKADAIKLFDFESTIVKKYNKQYLLDPKFTRNWFFGLRNKFFQNYPQEKQDILKERFFTVSELCKIIDEAEWHFWNSHEGELSDDVWNEICDWRLKGAGGDFGIKYFEMIAATTGLSEEVVGLLSSEQGRHLNCYKWS